MASSVVDIANLALTLLGAEPIISITDDTVAARTMNLHYGPQRDAELNAHTWRFAVKRAALPSLAAAPIGRDYILQYQLPNDFLAVVLIGDSWPGQDRSDYRQTVTAEYSIEANAILTNYPSPLNLKYVAAVTDTGLFDPTFVLAFAARLARAACKKITGSDTAVQMANAAYKDAISEAVRSNALLSPPEFPGDDSWVMARLG